MSSGTQVDLDWAGPGPLPAGGANDAGTGSGTGAGAGTGIRDAAYLTDEEILGIDPIAAKPDAVARHFRGGDLESAAQKRSGTEDPGYSNAIDSSSSASGTQMPAWMAALASDPKHGAEAQQLWAEHQAFRAEFSSPDEARTIANDARALKEIFPGGMQEARALKQGNESLREAAQSIDRIDAAIFSGDVRAQSEVVAELARANPVAFRSLVAEATKVLAMLPGSAPVVKGHFSQMVDPPSPQDGFGGLGPAANRASEAPDRASTAPDPASAVTDRGSARGASGAAQKDSSVAAGLQTPAWNNNARATTAFTGPAFDPAAYASFERSTNEVVARDVRGSISDTLTRVLPDGVADGAAKRIGEDIFNEIHRALAADRTLSEQVGEALRDRRFGTVEQQRVAALIAGRAKQLVPSVARRVIGEWTSSVLGTARSKAARQAAAASRVDIAAPGGSLDSMPLRAMSSREVNYASMSDDEILGM